MNLHQRTTALAVRPHLPRRTIRLRLTAIYSGLFLLCGAGLLAITYVLVDSTTADTFSSTGANGALITGLSNPHHGGSHAASSPSLHASSGQPPLTPKQNTALAHQLQALGSSYHANELHHLLIYSGIALAIMAVLSVALGWLTAGRVLRPLRTITSAAREISATNLHRRLALDGPNDELKELGDTFDDLLGRLEDFIGAQRQFVANASHELRTPLALQRTVVEVALDDPEATMDSRRDALQRVLASGAQQERLIEALLTLTRGQAGPAKREPFDLGGLTDQVVLGRRAEALQGGVDIRSTLGPSPTTGDPRLIERLVINLIDNAIRYNVAGGHVEVTTTVSKNHATLSVTNTGPQIPPEAVDRLLQPFQRLSSERTGHGEGLGLGLSIVHAIAAAHRAQLDILSRPTGGLNVEVRFPLENNHNGTAHNSQVTAVAPISVED
jgi:signal transduction histidine kinase